MEEKADKGSAFLFPLFSVPIRASSVPKDSKLTRKISIIFNELIVKTLGNVIYSLYLCT